MSKFNKGDAVINTETNEEGIIIEICPPRRGQQLYRVKYNDREHDEKSAFLIPNVDLTDPFERCRQNYYDHYTEYAKENTVFKILYSNNSTISSLKASKTLFRAYQFKPLLKFINSDNKRLLIADEVGLGKTIEAGHIMMELKARGEFRNAMVICPNSLCEKWATELTEKFGLEFAKIDDKKTLLYELSHHNGNIRIVINYEKLRDKRKDENEILQTIAEYNIKFSLVVCDESHKLRNSNTFLYKGIDQLLNNADSVVFMSATPIMIDENNLYNQLHLLDSNVYDKPEVFRNNIQLNKPFVHALSQLNNGTDLHTIANELSGSIVTTSNTINDFEFQRTFKIGEYFQEYPIFQNIIRQLTTGKDTPALRAQLQYNLSEMSPMNTIFSRTRKREVTQDYSQAERNPHTQHIDLSPAESEAYDDFIDNYMSENDNGQSYILGLIAIKRQLASSVWACMSNNDELDEGIDSFSQYRDEKFNALLKILDVVFNHGNKKIIIFAVFKKTLKYLKIRLTKAGYKCAILYGDPEINKNDVLDKFQNDDSVQVLLSSEVGSEGLDMQFCNSLVNYDLPWNPMVVEQRIGRIDRFGQESEKINIYNIVVKDSILENIYSRLLDRIGIFRESIGDLEAILDSEFEQDGKMISVQKALNDLEEDFYSDKLSIEELERKREQIERAIENERLNLQKIEKGLTNTLTNDSYFRNEISKIVNNNAYVTSHELYQFVLQLIKDCLQTCSLKETSDNDIYTFTIPKSDPRVLKRFLEQHQSVDQESCNILHQFLNRIENKLELRITFNQELAFKNKSLFFINIYHPIIKAGVNYYEKYHDKSQCTFFYELPAVNLPMEIKKGKYMLAIYKISVSRILFGKLRVTESLYPILFDIENKCLIQDHDLAERFMGSAQVNGRYAPMEDNWSINSNIIDDMRYDFKDVIDDYINTYRIDLQARIDNNKMMRRQQTIQYYDSRIKNMEAKICQQEREILFAMCNNDEEAQHKAEKPLPLMKKNLSDLIEQKESELEKINCDVQLKVIDEIKSLNLVNVV